MGEATERASAWSESRVARLALAAAVLGLAVAALRPLDNPDTFGHLAQGREIARLGHVPDVDTRSFWQPAPAPWRNYEWLSDLWSWQIFSTGGPSALVGWNALLVALAGAFFVVRARSGGGIRAAVLCALLLLLVIPGARYRLVARPEVVALPLAALYLVGLAALLDPSVEARARRRWLAGLALAHLAWVNLHGSHLLGVALTLVHLACAWRVAEARRSLVALVAAEIVASCVSPFGPAIALDAIEHLANPAYRTLVPEWGPFQPGQPPWIVGTFLVQAALLAVVTPSAWRGGPTSRALLLCNLLLAFTAARSLRFAALFVLSSTPLVAIAATRALAAIPWGRLRTGAAVAALLITAGLGIAATHPRVARSIGVGVDTTHLPAEVAAWLVEHARAPRVLAQVDDAWYLAFAAPNARFFIDGRLPFFGVDHIRRLQRAYADPAYLASLVEAYDVDTVLVRHSYAFDLPARDALRMLPGWRLALVSDVYALFVRDDLAVSGPRPPALGLAPSYDPVSLLGADAEARQALAADLGRLPKHPNAEGYRAWVRALLTLAPFARAGGESGLRTPASTQEQATFREALVLLRRAAVRASNVPIVQAAHALVAALACELDEAERALARASEEGASRETLLVPQEIALRRGRTQEVTEFLARAEALPRAADDAWIAALRASLASPPRCP